MDYMFVASSLFGINRLLTYVRKFVIDLKIWADSLVYVVHIANVQDLSFWILVVFRGALISELKTNGHRGSWSVSFSSDCQKRTNLIGKDIS